jgi:putative ABC transport system permease protein
MIPVSYNVRNLVVRKTTAIATTLGLALVVFVFASTLMLSNGIDKTLGRSAASDVAIVLRKGASAELESNIGDPNVSIILNDKALPQAGSGPTGVGELMVVILLDKLGTDGVSNVQIRGIREASLAIRRGVKITSGRAPNPGSDEVIVGKSISGRFKGLEVGGSFELRKNRPVKVVGVFEDGGSASESEVWADLETVRTTFKREAMVSSVRVRIEPAKFDAFKASLESNRQLNVQAMREADYYEKQSEATSTFIKVLGTVIAIFFSFGAMMGGMITMHAAVANRQREIGTLRALGFGRFSILTSFLFESILLSLVGGAIGMLAALGMGLVRFSMLNFATWSEIVFSFEPTPQILLSALMFATVMGVLGGFFPAIRAARVSPVDAMRT